MSIVFNYNKYKFLFLSFFLFCFFDTYSQKWQNLTTQNTPLYFVENGFRFDGKETINKEGDLAYTGIKETSDDQILYEQIVFENGIPYGRIFSSSTKVSSASASGLGDLGNDFFAKSLFLQIKDDLINQIGRNNFTILKNTDREYETDWKKINDIEIQHSLEIVNPKTSYGPYYVEYSKMERLVQEKMEIAGVNVTNIDIYNLKEFVNLFFRDLFFFSEKYDERYTNLPNEAFYNQNIDITFSQLEGSIIALAYGKDDDKNIIVKVDPKNWANSSITKKFYIIYHELGHDILNFAHGDAGKMMYNFVDREYTWDEFVSDKKTMFKIYFDNKSK